MRIEDCQIVCISLDRRPDRWAFFKERADAAGLTVNRLSAVDAAGFKEPAYQRSDISLLTAHNLFYEQRRSHYEIDRPGAIGASLSHFKAWKGLLDTPGAAAVIVFEDDCAVPHDFRARLDMVLASMDSVGEWDVIQFQNTRFTGGETGCEPAELDVASPPWHVCKSLMGAHAYMVSRHGAQRLLERAFPIELHVDAYMAFLSRLGYIKMLWHPMLDLDPPSLDSDILHGTSGILNVPTRMETRGVVALDTREVLGLLALAAVCGAAVSLAYLGKK